MTTDAQRPSESASPSVLTRPGASLTAADAPPGCFEDLHLDQVVAAIVEGREMHDVRPVFHTPLSGPADVAYRHEVFRDLEDATLRDRIEEFSSHMRRLHGRARSAHRIRNPLQAQRLALDGALAYCRAVAGLSEALERHDVASQALRALAAYLGAYVASSAFRALRDAAERLEHDLGAVTYRLTILEDRVRVRRAAEQRDYGVAVERTFRKFRRGPDAQRVAEHGERVDMNTVEAAILDRVARLHPDVFGTLFAFCAAHATYVDPVVARFEREAQFYLAYLAYARRFEALGLRFCLPEVSATDKRVQVRQTYDLALAGTLLEGGGPMVPNDIRLEGVERIFVVTGANQGGKSTFARTFGQIHYLASLGCPVPGQEARLFLFDRVLTHFEREEDLRTLQGKLQEELTRLHDLLTRATPRSIVIMNEAFSSTAADDARDLGRETLERLLALDVLGVYVTFVDELSSFDARIASVSATVDPDDPARRTFEIVRRASDGRAHAVAIARAYRLTYDELRLRVRP